MGVKSEKFLKFLRFPTKLSPFSGDTNHAILLLSERLQDRFPVAGNSWKLLFSSDCSFENRLFTLGKTSKPIKWRHHTRILLLTARDMSWIWVLATWRRPLQKGKVRQNGCFQEQGVKKCILFLMKTLRGCNVSLIVLLHVPDCVGKHVHWVTFGHGISQKVSSVREMNQLRRPFWENVTTHRGKNEDNT